MNKAVSATGTVPDHDLHLEHFLPFRLSRVSNAVSQGIAETYAEQFDLSVTEWRVVAIVGRFPDISAVEIVSKGALDKVAVSRAVRRLIDRGLLERHASTEDRRRSHLSLSPAGSAIYRDIVPAALAYESELLECLSPDEKRTLEQIMDRLWQRTRALRENVSG